MSLTVRETMLAFRRSPLLSFLGILTIAFSLFAFGLFGLVALNIRNALERVEERVEIRAFVTDGTPVEAVAAAMGDIAAFPEVAKVDHVTQEEALARARQELGEFSDVFEADFLPASMDIRLKTGFRDPATVATVADRLRGYDFVDDIRYGQEWVEKLYELRNIATVAGLTLGFAFAAVAVIIIGATIRVAVLARSHEISIMRLVGATDGFIRRPFLLEGALKGIIGGLFALLLTWLAGRMIARFMQLDAAFFESHLIALGLLFGALIGTIGSALSIGRHLRHV